MKNKFVGGLLVMAMLGGIVLTAGPATAKPDQSPQKTEVCHVTSASDVTNGLSKPERTWAWGVVISVSDKAVGSHDNHGDSTDFRTEPGDPGWINLHEAADRDGLTISDQAECFFEVF